MLFDQALLIELEKQRFVANFQYTVRKGEDYKIVNYKEVAWKVTDKPAYLQNFTNFEAIKDNDYDRFDQNCDKTMIGFVQ